jgi:hypothetical protein
VLEPNLMEINLSELNLTEFTAVNNLVAVVTMEHNPNPQFTKGHLTTLNLNNFKLVEGVGLKLFHRGHLE